MRMSSTPKSRFFHRGCMARVLTGTIHPHLNLASITAFSRTLEAAFSEEHHLLNGMVYTRGSSEDYDRIANITGDSGWSWERLQPYIRKNERWTPPVDNHSTVGQFDPSVHSLTGINSVTLSGFSLPIDQRVIQTTRELPGEFTFTLDMNSGHQLGVGWAQLTIGNGSRSSSATSYLGSKYRHRVNLHILLNSQVTRVLHTRNTTSVNGTLDVRTVELVDVSAGINPGSQRVTVSAKKEVILSAGTFGTPNVLLHSGIGDQSSLAALGITPVLHLPSVGRNLSDHVAGLTSWSVNTTTETLDSIQRNSTQLTVALAEWNNSHTGLLSSTGGNIIGFHRLPDNATIFRETPDPAPGPNTAHYELLFVPGSLFPAPEGNFFSVAASLLTATSRGSVTINSSNPLAAPVINPNSLAEPFDLFTLRESIRAIFRFVQSPTWNGVITGPASSLAGVNISDDAQLDSYLRTTSQLGYHVVGTSAMTARGAAYGVTDPDLKVKGVSGLRIVDASVIPFLPSAHTQVPTYIIAERAADLIKQAWKRQA
ncbi:hypothetical protein HGRIS_005286 [Hohenbuehelia grisea]|uniref:Glucose-methanol-choline oxidoreductase N-terminal domain-containing protein n=1 Tax=Hohenbuehelia grisea TaxID=104357 RepID=A0ABR3JEL3_9AGAR